MIDALIALGWLETEHSLQGEGTVTIQGILRCGPEEAVQILSDLQLRKRIDIEMTPGGELKGEYRIAHWRWIRPSTDV